VPNPAPFPPTPYDNMDWIRATTALSQSGTPTPPSGGVLATDGTVVTIAGFTGGGVITTDGPLDGNPHTLLWLTMRMNMLQFVCTTPVVFGVRAQDVTNTYCYGVMTAPYNSTSDIAQTASCDMVFPGGQTFPPGSGGPGIKFILDRVITNSGVFTSSSINFAYAFAWS
jgi:hypothetical protein